MPIRRLLRAAMGCDPVVVLVAVVAVVVGSVLGAAGSRDVDEAVYRSTILRMQEGDSYYEAHVAAIIEDKQGIAPSAVRSIRTPVVSYLLVAFPASTWRWLAALPALGLCFAAAALAGPDRLAQRLAAGLTGVWMLVSLPYLYLHAELWGSPLVLAAGLLLRRDRDRPAAVLALAATAMRELYALSLLAGLALRRRTAWLGALMVAGAGALLHAHWAREVLDPDGFDPPLRAVDSYLAYVSPGSTGIAQGIGLVLLGLAAAGLWLRRHDPALRFLALGTLPLVAGAALAGRSYWTLTWCGTTSAAAGVAMAALGRRLGWYRPVGVGDVAPYARE